MKSIFLFRFKNHNETQSCAYIEDGADYNSRIPIHGVLHTYYNYPAYHLIETILTSDEYSFLANFNATPPKLTTNLLSFENKNGDITIESVVKKLKTKEANAYFRKIIESEKKILENRYMLKPGDVNYIFNSYKYDLKDSGIINSIFSNVAEFASDFLESLGCSSEEFVSNCGKSLKTYKKSMLCENLSLLGKYIIEIDKSDLFLILKDGRVVVFS
ncbi:MAG: hypothetical protein LBU04_05820 [Christensenellaceae bacterium]|nr:hypothetical protein [Christensenellaceae bacterium]